MIWDQIGWEQLYNIGMAERWYEGLEVNPFESVFYSDAEDLIYNIAKLNLLKH